MSRPFSDLQGGLVSFRRLLTNGERTPGRGLAQRATSNLAQSPVTTPVISSQK
jgi:hypothetical protein